MLNDKITKIENKRFLHHYVFRFTYYIFFIGVARTSANIEDGELYNNPETLAEKRSVKKVFVENLQNSQENTCARDSSTGVFL